MESQLTAPGNPKLKISKILPLNSKENEVEEIICRICMDGENKFSPLIAPCSCSGSVKYVHENCLKTWIYSHSIQLNSAYCELCKTNFIIDLSFTKKCSFSMMIQYTKSHLILFSVLFTIMSTLFTLIYLMANKHITLGSNSNSIMYTIGLMIICAIAGMFILIIIIIWFKSICCQKRLKNWRILSRDIKSNECIEVRNETLIVEIGKEIEANRDEFEFQPSVYRSLGSVTERVHNEYEGSRTLIYCSELQSPSHSTSKSFGGRNRAYSDPLNSL